MTANKSTIIKALMNEQGKLKFIKDSVLSMRKGNSLEGREYSKYYRAHVIKTIHTLEGLLLIA